MVFVMSRLERALTELGGDIEVALEEIRVPAALVDRSGTVRWLNHAGRREAGDRTGEDVTSVIGPGAREQVEALLAKVLSRGEPTEGRLPVRVADGSFVVREISVVPVREGETVVGVFGLGQRSSESSSAASTTASAALTPRQRQVLNLLAAGRSTQQIAAELGVSHTTVRNHVANLMAALGVHTRLQAVITASKAGMIDSTSR
jgi:DNA-binding CsgD family transcriptional regulator